MSVSALLVHPTLELHARKYPGVPMEVILKEDLLRRGMTFTDAATTRVPSLRRFERVTTGATKRHVASVISTTTFAKSAS